MLRISVYVFALVLSASCLGCGKPTDGKVPVSGRVTWNGEPLEQGRITFLEPGKSTESAEVVSGQYRIRLTEGVKNVGITSFEENSYTERDGRQSNVPHQFLPPQYNDETTLSASVSDASTSFDFELIGEKMPKRDNFEKPSQYGNSGRPGATRPRGSPSRPR